MAEIYFETEEYRFALVQVRDSVVVGVMPISRHREFKENDAKLVMEFFEDMGKWETFVGIGLDLLKDLGVIQADEKTKESSLKGFGRERYLIEAEKPEHYDLIRFYARLTKEERYLREGRKQSAILSVEEIEKQIRNILKMEKSD